MADTDDVNFTACWNNVNTVSSWCPQATGIESRTLGNGGSSRAGQWLSGSRDHWGTQGWQIDIIDKGTHGCTGLQQVFICRLAEGVERWRPAW